MLNFSRNDRPSDVKEIGKPAVKPSPYGTSPLTSAPPGTPSVPRASTTSPQPAVPAAGPAPQSEPTTAEPSAAPEPSSTADVSGSKLIVGVNIRLKGVEISNCDVLVIEGQVEATVNSKAMEISKPGTLTGTAQIDVAEIHGDFSGELTARTKLVVHGTGRVTGTIRYGKLVVAEGGVLTGDLRQIDGITSERADKAAESKTSTHPHPDMRSLLSPQH